MEAYGSKWKFLEISTRDFTGKGIVLHGGKPVFKCTARADLSR